MGEAYVKSPPETPRTSRQYMVSEKALNRPPVCREAPASRSAGEFFPARGLPVRYLKALYFI